MFNTSFWGSIGVQLGRTAGKVVALVLAAALILGAYWSWQRFATKDSPTFSESDSVSVASAPRPIIESGEITSTSPSGETTTHPSDGPTEGTVTVTDTSSEDSLSTEATLVLKPQDDLWFPQWQSVSPVKRIGGDAAAVWTPPSQPLFDWSTALTVGTGLGPSIPPSIHVSVSLLTVTGRVHVGVFANIPPHRLKRSSVGVAVGTEIRRNLQLSIGLTHRKTPLVALTYRF